MTVKQKVLEIVNRIPYAKVAYFGQICEVLAAEYDTYVTAQVAGWIMSGLKENEYHLCPWHRVVVKSGFVASLKLGYKGILQIEKLREEGVEVIDNVVDMDKYCVPTKQLLQNPLKDNNETISNIIKPETKIDND
jgi:alkylated DNA nucleotide flippase Atl1